MSRIRHRARPGTLDAAPGDARIYRLPVPRAAQIGAHRIAEAARADLRALASVVGGRITDAAERLGLPTPDALHDLSAGRSVPSLPTLFALSRAASGLPGGGHLATLAAASGLVPTERLRPLVAALSALTA